MLDRRSVLQAAALFAAPAKAATREPVHLSGDGVPLTPRERAELLVKLTTERDIAMDTYSQGGVVTELERRMAESLGKECAVFIPTGTLANHLGVRLLANGRKVLVQRESHLYRDEGDCAQQLSNLNLVPLSITLDEVKDEVERAGQGRVAAPVGAISIETPIRRANGQVVPFPVMESICTYARSQGMGLHLDGSRLFLASPYTGIPVRRYAALFDTVYVSTWKYFNANFGAILAGPEKLLKDLYHQRRMFGGGIPHAWAEAAVTLHYFEGFEQRFSQAVRNAEKLLRSVNARRVENGTNIAFLRTPARHKELRAAGIVIDSPRGNEVAIRTNETLLRRAPDELAELLRAV